jgi:hypothetical protein
MHATSLRLLSAGLVYYRLNGTVSGAIDDTYIAGKISRYRYKLQFLLSYPLIGYCTSHPTCVSSTSNCYSALVRTARNKELPNFSFCSVRGRLCAL